MKFLIYSLLLLIPGLSQASTQISPEISCHSADVFDAGYGLEIGGTKSEYIAKLYEDNYGGGKSLGQEAVNIDVRNKGEDCILTVTQVRDVDGNELKLTIHATQAGGRNFANLQLKINGRQINDLLSEMSCYINESSYNHLCQPNNNLIYKQNGNSAK